MNFLRRSWDRFSKLGRKRKKKQVWRKPKGRDNKMRDLRRGYPKVVRIGYKKKDNKRTPIVLNLAELNRIKKGSKIIIGKVGKKKKFMLINKSKELGIEIEKINIKKYLEKKENEFKK